jgi:hypothetical protein
VRVILLLLGIAVAAPLAAQDAAKDAKPHIYIAAGAAWRENEQGAGARAEPEIRTVEIAADFDHSCGAAVIVTADLRAADYVAEFSRHVKAVPLTAIAVNRTDVSIYRTTADLVGASSKSSLGGAVKAACEVIKKDWPEAPHDVEPKRRDRDPHPTGRTAALTQ